MMGATSTAAGAGIRMLRIMAIVLSICLFNCLPLRAEVASNTLKGKIETVAGKIMKGLKKAADKTEKGLKKGGEKTGKALEKTGKKINEHVSIEKN